MDIKFLVLLWIFFIGAIALLEYLGVWMIKTTLKRYSEGVVYIGRGVSFYKNKNPIWFHIFVVLFLLVSVAVMFVGLLSVLALIQN